MTDPQHNTLLSWVLALSGAGGFFWMVAKVYKSWTFKRKYQNVTDATIRRELWGKLADSERRGDRMTKIITRLTVEIVKIRNLHTDCVRENGYLVRRVTKLEKRLEEVA